MRPAPAVSHAPTANVVSVMGSLDFAWTSTKALSERAGVSRSTLKPMLEELTRNGWAEHRRDGDAHLWRLGPELPRIGLAYHRELQDSARQLQALSARVLEDA